MSPKSSSLAGVLLVVLALSGCSGGDDGGTESYCDDLKASAAEVKALAGGELDGLDQAIDAAHRLADEAPPEVRDDWKRVDTAVSAVENAFDDAGLELSDVEKIQSTGELPDGIDVEKLAGLSDVYADISSEKFRAAQQAITQHAKTSCKVDLTTS